MSLEIIGWGTALPEGKIMQDHAAVLAASLRGVDGNSGIKTAAGNTSEPDHFPANGGGSNNGSAQSDAPPSGAQARSRQFEPQALDGRWMRALYRQTGIRSRHSVLLSGNGTPAGTQTFYPPADDTTDRGPTTAQRMAQYQQRAPALAAAAATGALATAGVDPPAITHLVTVSCSGFTAPGVEIELIDRLGLRPTVGRTHVGFMGCHGALNGLAVARAFAVSTPGACVLLAAVELCSLHFQYGPERGKQVANALFADGAAALVGRAATAGDGAARPGEGWRLTATGSRRFPDSAGDMTWNIGDHGFEMTLSPAVADHIGAHLRPWLESWLGGLGLRVDDIPSWAVHPGGPKILAAVEEALELGPRALAISREVLARCGNMSSPTVLFILEQMARQGAPRPCLALGFGPGLVAEAALFM